MAEPQWTLNGRAVPAGEAAPKANAASTADAASQHVSPSDAAALPLDALLADRSTFSAEEDAEIQRAMGRHKVDREHPVIQVVVEMLLYRRQYREDQRGYSEAQGKALADLQAVASDIKGAQQRGPTFVIQPTASAALFALVTAVVAVVAWLAGQGVGQTLSDARLNATAPQVSALLTTPAGRAALGLVRDNGDALPKILSQCHRFVSGGRDAMSCTLWAQGTGLPLTTLTPFDRALATIAAVPAWPVVLLIAVGVGVWLVLRKRQSTSVRASRAW